MEEYSKHKRKKPNAKLVPTVRDTHGTDLVGYEVLSLISLSFLVRSKIPITVWYFGANQSKESNDETLLPVPAARGSG